MYCLTIAIEFDQRSNPRPSFHQEIRRTIHKILTVGPCLVKPPDWHHGQKQTAPQNTLHAHARAKPKTPKSASAVLRLSTTHGPKVRPIVPLALHCRNISQGLIGMGSMPLRYQLHTYFPSARCRRWFRQCCHTKREEREGGMRETLSDRVVVVEDARYTLTHTHTSSYSAEAAS